MPKLPASGVLNRKAQIDSSHRVVSSRHRERLLKPRFCYSLPLDVCMQHEARAITLPHLILLLFHLLHQNLLLLVFAALVLEPNANDARGQSGHLGQLLLHQGVGARIGGIARLEGVQLLLVQHRSNAGLLRFLRLPILAAGALPTGAATAATRAATRGLAAASGVGGGTAADATATIDANAATRFVRTVD